jgi:hypothetical protein
MSKNQKIIIAAVFVLILVAIVWLVANRQNLTNDQGDQTDTSGGSGPVDRVEEFVNDGEVSPITGLPCENWDRRPLAVMTAADVAARPSAGLSQADMVIEMPVITASVTRLMAVYICNTPPEVGSMRSSRHDFIHLARGFDAIYAHWGGSIFALEKIDDGAIENLNCNDDGGQPANVCCFRKEGMDRREDTGYARPDELYACAERFGYQTEARGQFGGYPHKPDASLEERPDFASLRVAFAGSYAVSYDYNKETNAWERVWGGVPDVDRNNEERLAPKNVVVMIAESQQIEGQYNNVELGDPWYDTVDSGDAFYYMNGQEMKGSWEKDRLDASSKLRFLNENGEEVEFVPGQIWVEILEPGQVLRFSNSEQPEAPADPAATTEETGVTDVPEGTPGI